MAQTATERLSKRAWLLRRFLRTLAHLRIARSKTYDKHYLPEDGAGILAIYHESMIDVLYIAGALSRLPVFMGMAAIGNWPVIGWVARAFRVVLVDRADAESRAKALDAAEQSLNDGCLHAIFITGKCVGQGESAVYQNGPAKLAMRTGLPVYPVGLKGTGKVFPLVRDLPPRQFSRIPWLRRLEETALFTRLHNFRVRVFFWERLWLQEPVSIVFGKPLYPAEFTTVTDMTFAIGQAIEDLRAKV